MAQAYNNLALLLRDQCVSCQQSQLVDLGTKDVDACIENLDICIGLEPESACHVDVPSVAGRQESTCRIQPAHVPELSVRAQAGGGLRGASKLGAEPRSRREPGGASRFQ